MPRYTDYASEFATINPDGTTTIGDVHYQWDGTQFVKLLHERSFTASETSFRVEQIARNAIDGTLSNYIDPGGQYSLLPIDIAWLRIAIQREYLSLEKAQTTFAGFRTLGPLEWAFDPSLPDRISEQQELAFFGSEPFRSVIPAVDVLTKPNAYVNSKAIDTPDTVWGDQAGVPREQSIGEAWANHPLPELASAARALVAEGSSSERAEPKVSYSLASTAYEAWIQKLYLAFFLRPADPGGFNYYAQKLDVGGTDVPTIATGFGNSPEYLETYLGLSTTQRIDAIYRNLFDRPAEPDGLTYWGDRLDSGVFSISNIAFSILVGAQNADLATINNRIAVSAQFTATLDTQREKESYNGLEAASAARQFLGTVTSDQQTVNTATSATGRTIKYLGSSAQVVYTAAGDSVTLNSNAKSDLLIYSGTDQGRSDIIYGFQLPDRLDLSALALTNAVQTRTLANPQAGASQAFFGTYGVVIARTGSDSYVYLDVDKDGAFTPSLDAVVRLVGVELQASALTI